MAVLSDISTHPSTATAAARLSDADPHVRRVAILELADLGEPDFVPQFIAALREDPSPGVHEEAARILAEWEQEDVVATLCGALSDAEQAVRQAAAQSLSELKDAQSARVLLPWMGQSDPFVRESILHGLRELRSPHAFSAAIHSLNDDVAAVRLEAIAVLGWLKDPRALAPLGTRLASDP